MITASSFSTAYSFLNQFVSPCIYFLVLVTSGAFPFFLQLGSLFRQVDQLSGPEETITASFWHHASRLSWMKETLYQLGIRPLEILLRGHHIQAG